MCRADLDWRDFTFNGTSFDRLVIPVAYDGKRLLIPGLSIAGQAGNVDLEFFFDGTSVTPALNGKITSNLDPTILKGVFGQGMDNFSRQLFIRQWRPEDRGDRNRHGV